MAVEWIPMDTSLPVKAEIQQIVDFTDTDEGIVCGRLFMFWRWVWLEGIDGSIPGGIKTITRICGGTEDFWRVVQRVGWVIFSDDHQILVPGWEKWFSKSTKNRLRNARNQQDSRRTKTDSNYLSIKPFIPTGMGHLSHCGGTSVTALSPSSHHDVTALSPSSHHDVIALSPPDGDVKVTEATRIRHESDIKTRSRIEKEEIRKENEEEIYLAPSPNSSDSEPVPPSLTSQPSKPKSKPNPDPANIDKVVLTFPVVGNAECPEFHIRQGLVNEFQADFPDVDVVEQFRAAFRWIKASPERRKTARGMRKFLHGWIERSLSGSRGMQSVGTTGPPRQTASESDIMAALQRTFQKPQGVKS